MKTVKKANKVLTIDDSQLSVYLKDGFDEVDDNGKIKSESPNKNYSVAEVKKLKDEYELKLATAFAENEKLKKKLDKKNKGEEETTQEDPKTE